MTCTSATKPKFGEPAWGLENPKPLSSPHKYRPSAPKPLQIICPLLFLEIPCQDYAPYSTKEFQRVGEKQSNSGQPSAKKHLESKNTTKSSAFILAHSHSPHFKTQNLSTKGFPQNKGMEPYSCATYLHSKAKHVLLPKTTVRMV